MKSYNKPSIEVINFSAEDIITASGVIVNAESFTGADRDMYEIYVNNSEAKNTNVSVFTW